MDILVNQAAITVSACSDAQVCARKRFSQAPGAVDKRNGPRACYRVAMKAPVDDCARGLIHEPSLLILDSRPQGWISTIRRSMWAVSARKDQCAGRDHRADHAIIWRGPSNCARTSRLIDRVRSSITQHAQTADGAAQPRLSAGCQGLFTQAPALAGLFLLAGGMNIRSRGRSTSPGSMPCLSR